LVKIADNIPGGRTICAFGEPVRGGAKFCRKFKDELSQRPADEERRAKE